MTTKILEAKIENQLRIHWRWLKDTDYKNVSGFINAIIRREMTDNEEMRL